MKIAINKCWGGFGLSKLAYEELGLDWDGYGYDFSDKEKRTDPKLISVIEKLGKKASGGSSKVVIVEIPDGVKFTIDDYDGMETIHEAHRSW